MSALHDLDTTQPEASPFNCPTCSGSMYQDAPLEETYCPTCYAVPALSAVPVGGGGAQRMAEIKDHLGLLETTTECTPGNEALAADYRFLIQRAEKAEARLQEEEATTAEARRALGGLYATVFGDGGHRQNELEGRLVPEIDWLTLEPTGKLVAALPMAARDVLLGLRNRIRELEAIEPSAQDLSTAPESIWLTGSPMFGCDTWQWVERVEMVNGQVAPGIQRAIAGGQATEPVLYVRADLAKNAPPASPLGKSEEGRGESGKEVARG